MQRCKFWCSNYKIQTQIFICQISHVLTQPVNRAASTTELLNLLNLIKHQRPDIDKIYLYVKYSYESKYQLLINKREKVGTRNLKIQKHSLIIHKQFRKVLIMFDDMIPDMEFDKKLSPIVTEFI